MVPSHRPQKRVLIVDDDRDVADLVQGILVDEGLDVSSLHDATRSAIEAAVNEFKPDCVLLDGGEPARYGRSWDVATWLAVRAPPVPCVMLSAHTADREEAMVDTSERAKTARVTAVIGKPFDIDRLVTVVRNAIGDKVAMLSDRANSDSAAALISGLRAAGAREIVVSKLGRVWATFRGPEGSLYKIYRWRAADMWFVGRYDVAGQQLEALGHFGDLEDLLVYCANRIGTSRA